MYNLLFWLAALHTPAGAPFITSLDPNGVWVNGPQFTLAVTGTGFSSNAEVRWDGAPLQTTFVSETRVTAVVPATLLTTAATHQITVRVGSGAAALSNSVAFSVFNPAPGVSSLSPASAPVFSAPLPVRVNGSNFVPASVVRWNGANRSTTFLSPTALSAMINVVDLAEVGAGNITVHTPGPGGGTTQAVVFQVVHPRPTITALTPASSRVTNNAMTLTVDGADFLSGTNSTVLWNGSVRATTFVSATRLTAALQAGDLGTAGSANVTVRTQAGGSAATSAAASFGILQPITTTPILPLPTPTDLPPELLPVYGGSSGTGFTRDCGSGSVLTGLRYRAGLVVDALGLVCRRVNADGTLGQELNVGTMAGNAAGTESIRRCPDGEVIGGSEIIHGLYVDGLAPFCFPWNPAQRTFQSGAVTSYFVVGASVRPTSTRSRETCSNTRQPARGIRGRAASFIDAVGFTCDEP